MAKNGVIKEQREKRVARARKVKYIFLDEEENTRNEKGVNRMLVFIRTLFTVCLLLFSVGLIAPIAEADEPVPIVLTDVPACNSGDVSNDLVFNGCHACAFNELWPDQQSPVLGGNLTKYSLSVSSGLRAYQDVKSEWLQALGDPLKFILESLSSESLRVKSVFDVYDTQTDNGVKNRFITQQIGEQKDCSEVDNYKFPLKYLTHSMPNVGMELHPFSFY
jgi:hypothetical protein